MRTLRRAAASQCYRDDAVMAFHMQHDTTEAYIQWLRRGGKELATPATPPKPSAAALTGFAATKAEECTTPSSGARKTPRTR